MNRTTIFPAKHIFEALMLVKNIFFKQIVALRHMKLPNKFCVGKSKYQITSMNEDAEEG